MRFSDICNAAGRFCGECFDGHAMTLRGVPAFGGTVRAPIVISAPLARGAPRLESLRLRVELLGEPRGQAFIRGASGAIRARVGK